MTREEAAILVESKWWTQVGYRERATFQLYEERLCMPFDVFHKAVEKALGRPVWTHEFADPKRLQDELRGDRPRPTKRDIINLIPKEKRVLLIHKKVKR